MMDRREVRAAGLGIAIVAAYLALVLASGRVDPADFARLFLAYLKGSLSLWCLLALAGLLWLLYVNRPRAGQAVSPVAVVALWVRARWARDRLISLVWPPLLFAALMASFNAFKQMILPAAGFRFDPLFADMDRALFLGHDPWRITHALFGSPTATGLIDKAYHGWFVPMALGLMVCAFLPRVTFRLRTQYLLSYIVMWIGVGSVLALPRCPPRAPASRAFRRALARIPGADGPAGGRPGGARIADIGADLSERAAAYVRRRHADDRRRHFRHALGP